MSFSRRAPFRRRERTDGKHLWLYRKRRRQERRQPELKGYEERDKGEQVEGRVGDKRFVPEGVFQPFRVVRGVFVFVGKPVVLVDREGQKKDRQNGPQVDRNIEIHRPARGSERGEQRQMQFVSEKVVRHRAFFLPVDCKGPLCNDAVRPASRSLIIRYRGA